MRSKQSFDNRPSQNSFVNTITETCGYCLNVGNLSGGFLRGSISLIFNFSLIFLFCLLALPYTVKCDENDFFGLNSYNLSPDSAQTEFDYASRGSNKFGDKCDNTLQCGFPGSVCDSKKKTCRCTEDLPITNHYDKCGKVSAHNESCFFNEQCEAFWFQTECRDGRCICKFDLQPIYKNGKFECDAKQHKPREGPQVDPTMIGILVAMALMFIIICVVLRLFSQARWRENRTIFNTPNPRLMNVSLLRESKLLHGQERRGSRMSVRGPSRQPSMASLRPHSPNPSLASRNSNSNGSVASIRSRCDSTTAGSIKGHHPPHHHHRKGSQQSNQQTPLITHVTPNPVAENVTIEIIEPNSKKPNNHHTDI